MGARCSTQVHIMSNFPLVFQIEKEKVMSSYVPSFEYGGRIHEIEISYSLED
jgi:hypothetical protein